jgi:hypothetical protein
MADGIAVRTPNPNTGRTWPATAERSENDLKNRSGHIGIQILLAWRIHRTIPLACDRDRHRTRGRVLCVCGVSD